MKKSIIILAIVVAVAFLFSGTDALADGLKQVSVGTCTGSGELYLYKDDPFQSINTSFTINRDQLLILTGNHTSDFSFKIYVNGIIKSPSLEISKSTPFDVDIYSVDTSPGDNIEIEGQSKHGARGGLQGFLAQTESNPVYDISSLQVVFDGNQSNSMYLDAGTFSYAFFDKYSINSPGQSNDNRKLQVTVSGPDGVIHDKTYTQPSPSPVEGAVVGSFSIPNGKEGIYTLSVDTEDSIYWLFSECPQPFCGDGIKNGDEICDGTDGVGPGQICSKECTLTDLNFCGDGIKQSPNDMLLGGPLNDGFETCDGTDGVSLNQTCSNQCTLSNEPFCGDGKLDSGEVCDDGNNKDGDGCSATCKPEEDEDDCDGSIGNYVWLDENEDGVQDDSENGLDDIRMKLIYAGDDDDFGDSDDETFRTKTNSKGRYIFEDLCEGKYKVYVKDEDVTKYFQTYDPDDKEDNKTKVTLKGDNDHHTKADFGYHLNKVSPATGSGQAGIFGAIMLTLGTLITFKRRQRNLENLA